MDARGVQKERSMSDRQLTLVEEFGVPVSNERVGYLKYLGYGSSGTGKSALAGSMPGKTAVLAGEPQGGLATRRRALELGKDPDKNVIIFYIEDNNDPPTGQLRFT